MLPRNDYHKAVIACISLMGISLSLSLYLFQNLELLTSCEYVRNPERVLFTIISSTDIILNVPLAIYPSNDLSIHAPVCSSVFVLSISQCIHPWRPWMSTSIRSFVSLSVCSYMNTFPSSPVCRYVSPYVSPSLH